MRAVAEEAVRAAAGRKRMNDDCAEMMAVADRDDETHPPRCCWRRSKRSKRRMLPSSTSSNAGWLALLLVLLLVLALHSSADDGASLSQRKLSKRHRKHELEEPIDYTAYSCDALHHLQTKYPARFDRCEFAHTCNDGEGIIFPSLFCDDGSSNQHTRRSLLLAFLGLVLLLLFRLLGSTTDEFFTPGLEMFSLQLGLPPRFAGVTLLALGNGAPDVAATMNAILGDERKGYEMALGELTGTCMFVTSLILGAIVMLSSNGGKAGYEKDADANGEKSNDEKSRVEDESGGVPCRGPLLRDIAVLILVCVVSMSYLKAGVVDYGFVYTLLGMYGSYVLLVLCADTYHVFYHAPSIVRTQSSDGFISMNEMCDEEEDVFSTGDVERPPFVPDEQTPLVAEKTSMFRPQRPRSDSAPPIRQCKRHPAQNLSHLKSMPIHSHSIRDTVIEAMSNYSCHEEGALEDIAQDETQIRRSSSDGMPTSLSDHGARVSGHGAGWGPIQSDGTELGIPTFHPRHAVHPHHGPGGLLFLRSRSVGGGSSPASGRRRISWRDEEEEEREEKKRGLRKSSSADASSSAADLSAAASPTRNAQRPTAAMQVTMGSSHAGYAARDSDEEGESIGRPGSWGEAWLTNAQELVDHWRDFFADIYRNEENSVLDVIFLTVELPFTIVRKLTNPVPCDGYYCRPMVALSVALSPVWVWWYFLEQFDANIYSSFVGYAVSAITLVTALGVMRYSPDGEGPMDVYMVIPLTLYGFSIAATWLDSIADKLVDLLDLFGILLQIPTTVMGLTVLAFGNSLQDLVANVSLSKKGLSTMATTACFAGPIFNFCVGLGFGFWTLLKSTGKDHIRVELPRNIATGFWFTIANCALIVFTGVVIGKGVIGRSYGYVACGLYLAYIIVGCNI